MNIYRSVSKEDKEDLILITIAFASLAGIALIWWFG